MTAKEIKERLIATFDDGRNYPEGSIGDVLKNKRIKLLNELCTQLCQEQRKICSRQVSGWPDTMKSESEIEYDVLNAKMPEI